VQRRFIDAVAIVLRVAVAGQGGGIGMPVTVAVKRVTPQAGRWVRRSQSGGTAVTGRA
jgi:hypothetical protein